MHRQDFASFVLSDLQIIDSMNKRLQFVLDTIVLSYGHAANKWRRHALNGEDSNLIVNHSVLVAYEQKS